MSADMNEATPAQPPAGAQRGGSAREVIERAINNAEAHVDMCDIGAGGLRASVAELRALLATPPGAVERLCEQTQACLNFLDAPLCSDTMLDTGKVRAALAALRASPEAVGAGAGASGDLDTEKENLRDRLGKVTAELDEARKEAELIRATLGRVRATLGQVGATLEADALESAVAAALRVVTQRNDLKADLANARRQCIERARDVDGQSAEIGRLKAELAESQRRHEAWVERADKAESEKDALKADLAAARAEVERARADSLIEYATMGDLERRAQPPPAPPISERAPHDPMNHPAHYCAHPSGVECIQITEHLPFCVGNAIKYLWRHDAKNGVEDLKKARWYVSREIERRERMAAAEKAASGAQEVQRGN